MIYSSEDLLKELCVAASSQGEGQLHSIMPHNSLASFCPNYVFENFLPNGRALCPRSCPKPTARSGYRAIFYRYFTPSTPSALLTESQHTCIEDEAARLGSVKNKWAST
jgi:hypothetical protein